MALATCKIVWLLSLLKEMDISHSKPSSVYCDKKVSLLIAANSVYNEHTKHIEINCNVIREKLQAEVLHTFFVSSQHQLADAFTKALYPSQFQLLLSKMRLLNIHLPS